jgi:hypothetical protein
VPATAVDSFLASAPSELPQPERLIAVGDVHGDFSAAMAALRLAGVVDDLDHWSGGPAVVVQLGDQLDRGDDERQILDRFRQLEQEAAHAGGGFYWLIGNHEVMNAQIDFRYVKPKGFTDFNEFAPLGQGDGYLGSLPTAKLGRGAAFRPGGPYAKFLARNNVIMKVGDSVLVHGGLRQSWADLSLAKMNSEMRQWLTGASDQAPDFADAADGPLWDRTFGEEPSAAACAELKDTLDTLGANRMIIAHTVQENGITSACSDRVWRVDTGLASYYGGPTQVLEITRDGQINIVK